jgi:hypothetical protein
MKIKEPNYIKLLVKKYDSNDTALISKELITTTEKARMNALTRDFIKKCKNESLWANPGNYEKLPSINVRNYFIDNNRDLILHFDIEGYPILFVISLFNSNSCSLLFNNEKVTLLTATEYIKSWCQKFEKTLGTEKNLPRSSFYYINESGGYSTCDNSDGDCFCEDFKTEDDALKYLNGWSLDEIAFENKKIKLKGYSVFTGDPDYGSKLIFAESANKAKSWCIKKSLIDINYIELKTTREKGMDRYLNIAIDNELKWEIIEHQTILIEELGWQEI